MVQSCLLEGSSALKDSSNFETYLSLRKRERRIVLSVGVTGCNFYKATGSLLVNSNQTGGLSTPSKTGGGGRTSPPPVSQELLGRSS